MLLLTNEDRIIDMNNYSLDLRVKNDYDYFYTHSFQDEDYYAKPICAINMVEKPCFNVLINNFQTIIPVDWAIVIGDVETKDVSYSVLEELVANQEYYVLTSNPFRAYNLMFYKMKIIDYYPSCSWIYPKTEKTDAILHPCSKNDHNSFILLNEPNSKKTKIIEYTMF